MDGFRHLISPEGRTYVVGSFAPVVSQTVAPHTLILGTMPSNASHAQAQYYAHPSNAFWWIVGEALGFRRGGPQGDRDWPLEQFSRKPSKDILEALNKVQFDNDEDNDKSFQNTNALDRENFDQLIPPPK